MKTLVCQNCGKTFKTNVSDAEIEFAKSLKDKALIVCSETCLYEVLEDDMGADKDTIVRKKIH